MDDGAIDQPGGRLSRRDRALACIVPAVLVVVAAVGIQRFHEYRQSSWQGISMGMFATYDNRVSRFTRVEVDGLRVDASPVFGDLIDRGEVTPLGPAPAELAREVRDRLDAQRVTVEVWGIDIDTTDGILRLSIEPIRRVEA